MTREPAELRVDGRGRVELPVGLLVEAGISRGTDVVALSGGDGRIVIRRAEDGMKDLIEKGRL
ncbi:hypothetical protein [Streptomyces albidoflavus]|uniref:hypothetical protein n=1 Tax=Streptomyces albidoflavus TaxID=1886 RepID=UPI0033EAF9E0